MAYKLKSKGTKQYNVKCPSKLIFLFIVCKTMYALYPLLLNASKLYPFTKLILKSFVITRIDKIMLFILHC